MYCAHTQILFGLLSCSLAEQIKDRTMNSKNGPCEYIFVTASAAAVIFPYSSSIRLLLLRLRLPHCRWHGALYRALISTERYARAEK